MLSYIKRIFRRTPCEHGHTQSMAHTEGVADRIGSSAGWDVLDTELFTHDYNLWFAKIMFESALAKIIQREHLGHACINPKDVLEHVEASYGKRLSSKTGYLGTELFSRIDAARATGDDKTLQTFLDQMSDSIRQHCGQLRKDKVAELEAEQQPTSIPPHDTPSPEYTLGGESSSEDVLRATGTAENTKFCLTGSTIQTTTLSRPKSLLSPHSSNTEPAMHTYTSKLWEYATDLGKEPKYKRVPTSSGFYCEATLDGALGVGRARTLKEARHIASRDICLTLGILNG